MPINLGPIFAIAFFLICAGLLLLLIIIWRLVAASSKPGHALRNNVIATIITLGGLWAWFYLPMMIDEHKSAKAAEAHRAAYYRSKRIFDKLCESAGERVYHTAENVEGITLLKIWNDNDHRHMTTMGLNLWEYGGVPWQSFGKNYIEEFLAWRLIKVRNDLDGQYPDDYREGTLNAYYYTPQELDERYRLWRGYRFVDVKETDGQYQRYTYRNPYDTTFFKLDSTPITTPSRYTVTFTDPFDQTERENWIGHTRATITDSQTNTIMATKDWYSIDPEQGRNSASYDAERAEACPGRTGGISQIQHFTQSVLIPKQND